MKKLALKAISALSVALFLFSVATSTISAATVVSQSNMQGWAFESSGNASATFTLGPTGDHFGNGSGRLFTNTNGSQTAAITKLYTFTNLADITNLQYSAYANTQNGASKAQPFMIMSVQTDAGTDVLTFDPNGQSTSAQFQSWQHWNVKDDGVWDSNFDPDTESLSEYIAYMNAAYGPNITINSIKFQVGPGSELDVFDGNVDNFTIGVNGGDVTYDFESDQDSDGVLDPSDNCANVANPLQENFDAAPRSNGAGMVGEDVTVPNGDNLGDACDTDDDNDFLLDVNEQNSGNPSVLGACGTFTGVANNHANPARGDSTIQDQVDTNGTNGPSWDTDNDRVLDGRECQLGRNPRSTIVASDADRIADRGYCRSHALAGGTGDNDSDNLKNNSEFCSWGTDMNNSNSDGDTYTYEDPQNPGQFITKPLGDCKEVLNYDGNWLIQDGERLLIARAEYDILPDEWTYDINGDFFVNDPDRLMAARGALNLLSGCPKDN